MKTEIERLNSKVGLLRLALGQIWTIVDNATADGPPLALHELAPVRDLAEEVQAAVDAVDGEAASLGMA